MFIIRETVASAMTALQVTGESLFTNKHVDGSAANKLSQIDLNSIDALSGVVINLDNECVTTCSDTSNLTTGLLKIEVTTTNTVLVYVSDDFGDKLRELELHHLDALARYVVDELDAVNYPNMDYYIKYLSRVRDIVNSRDT